MDDRPNYDGFNDLIEALPGRTLLRAIRDLLVPRESQLIALVAGDAALTIIAWRCLVAGYPWVAGGMGVLIAALTLIYMLRK